MDSSLGGTETIVEILMWQAHKSASDKIRKGWQGVYESKVEQQPVSCDKPIPAFIAYFRSTCV